MQDSEQTINPEDLCYVEVFTRRFNVSAIVHKQTAGILNQRLISKEKDPITFDAWTSETIEEHLRLIERYKFTFSSKVLALRIFPDTKIIPKDADPKSYGIGLALSFSQGVKNHGS